MRLAQPANHRYSPPPPRSPASHASRSRGAEQDAMEESAALDAKALIRDNGDTVALWLRTSNAWLLVDFDVGHTDAFYTIWKEKYGAPFF